MILEGFDHALFLRDYWQRAPLLIRHAGAGFVDPIDADELAGLACDSEMESRIVTRTGPDSWHLAHGPFETESFSRLAENYWTLLVQAVDQVDADVDALKAAFDFLPAWRIDDVMVSYACDGGGVGPHFDQYDVFLIQGMGSRSWQIGQRCSSDTPLRKESVLSLIQDFNPVSEYVLETGDILYLPPRIAHHGVSRGESLCYSVGFRAPSMAELLQEFSDAVADRLSEDQRFQDTTFKNLADDAEIAEDSISGIFSHLKSLVDDRSLFLDAFGAFVTRPRYPERITVPDSPYRPERLQPLLQRGGTATGLCKNPASRFAYFSDRDRLRVYVDGRRIDSPRDLQPLVSLLCQTPWPEPLPLQNLAEQQSAARLLSCLLNGGSLLESEGHDQGSDE